jgi:hypothetical protein
VADLVLDVKRKSAEEDFVVIGDFRVPEAERLLEALTKAHIKLEIECDDGIRYAPQMMGNFGFNAKIRVWVAAEQVKHARKIQTDLFGEFSP